MQQFVRIGDTLLVRTTDIQWIIRDKVTLSVYIQNDMDAPYRVVCKDEEEANNIMHDLLRA